MKRILDSRHLPFVLFGLVFVFWLLRLALDAPLRNLFLFMGDWTNPIIKLVFFCLPALYFIHRPWLGQVARGWLVGSAFGLAYFALRLAQDQLFGNATQDWSPWLAALRHLIDGPIIEETLFRLALLPLLEKHRSFTNANIIQSLMFLAIHLLGWSWQRLPLSTILEFGVGVLIVGLICGWLTHKTQSVWAGVAFHWFWNLTALSLVMR